MEPNQKSNGALVGSIIIIIILVLGGIYLWTSKTKEAPKEEQTENVSEESGSGAAAIQAYNELDILENELNSTSSTDVSTGFEDIR